MFERPFNENGRYEKLSEELLKLEQALEDGLPTEKKKLFRKYLEINDKLQLTADEELFTNGFSLGARIMCDVFGADKG